MRNVLTEPDLSFIMGQNGKRVSRTLLIIENLIGRSIPKGYVIHHIDGDTLNDNCNNLQLFKTNGEHISYHAREAMAKG